MCVSESVFSISKRVFCVGVFLVMIVSFLSVRLCFYVCESVFCVS